jgi:excisionase family DNA binding protein
VYTFCVVICAFHECTLISRLFKYSTKKEETLLNERVEAEWIDYPTAKRYSGLSHTTLWRYVNRGELKAARVGRSVRLHLPTLREFIEHASREAVER